MSNRLTYLIVPAVVAVTAASQAQTSVLYIMDYGYGTLERVQGGSMLGMTASPTGRDLNIAVWGDVRTTDYNSAAIPGHLYDLAGNLVAANQYGHVLTGDTYDGTSDGKYNYTVEYQTGDVYALDRNWNTPALQFSTGSPGAYPWITMNPGDGTFWLGNYNTGDIEHWTAGGSFISSFSTGLGIGYLAGLAYDPADGTLWCGSYSSVKLYQFSTGGSLLSTVAPGRSNYVYGMEFDLAQTAVPEPASMAVLGIGALAAIRRKKRS